MEITLKKPANKSHFGKKANVAIAEVGKWYKFECFGSGNPVGYGKVVGFDEDGWCELEKYFELPSHRPYASTKWFDLLPWAIVKEEEE